MDISFVDAALGATVAVDTLSGRRDVAIPAGTQPGGVIALTGLGFPSLHSGRRGDQRIQVNVVIPKKLSRNQKKLLQQYRETKSRHGIFS